MKAFLFGSAALFILAGAANAADMPVKAMPIKAPPPIAYDWTGAYIGGYFGDAISNAKAHTDGLTSGVADLNQKGVTLGGTAGYNWQFYSRFLVGVEGDFGWLSMNKSTMEWNDFANIGEQVDWSGTLRLRAVWCTVPALLPVPVRTALLHLRDFFCGTATAGHTENSAIR